MFVRIYELGEMQGILDRLKWLVLGEPDRLHVHLPTNRRSTDGPPAVEDQIERLAWALECAWIAQYAASARTYYVRREDPRILNPFRIEPLDVLPSHAQPLDDLRLRRVASRGRLKALGDQLGNVLENTVGSGGADFCPTEVRELLLDLRLHLYARALETPETP